MPFRIDRRLTGLALALGDPTEGPPAGRRSA